ncbi:MAG: histidine kinase dimerization/phospho-acceptor domain-containing protein [Amaricoccus sp.]|uniref:sensor histidine kinase n=1 Tax=Amaricoccus sp. TaxID=1872485 RepID=UPI0039E36094
MASRPFTRPLVLLVLVFMVGFGAVGFFSIRRDVENLRVISQDNTQWAASQMEIELLRFRMALQSLATDPSPEAIALVHDRFDILWSRVFMMGHGLVGARLAQYDGEHGSVSKLASYLEEIDPKLANLHTGDVALTVPIDSRLDDFQTDLREYTLRVVRADAEASAQVRTRIQSSARTTAIISMAAVVLSMIALALILRENRRQRHLALLSQRSAEQAELASRAKSRFLSMMSHELRNPLNGILGPLALLGQSEMADRHRRLVVQAQQSGQSMLQLLSGLLDYGEMQDGRFQLKPQPFRVGALAEAIQSELRGEGVSRATVTVEPETPERIVGDMDRLRQIFVHLITFLLEGQPLEQVGLAFNYRDGLFNGDISLGQAPAQTPGATDWKLDLLTGLNEFSPDQVTAEALRPLIARGLISASGGVLSLPTLPDGRRVIRVSVRCEAPRLEEIRVLLQTQSAALATIYQAALKSDRVVFVSGDGPVDVVLVDSTSVGETPLMSRLRGRYPGALFVSLGLPQVPEFFDDVVESPNDMGRLRQSILGRLAS